MACGAARTALLALTVLLILGFLGIDAFFGLSPSFPRFLFAENLVYAGLMGASLYGQLSHRSWAYPLEAVVAAFAAGRMSRTVVTPWGTPGSPLWLAHVPPTLALLAAAVLAAYIAWRVEDGVCRP